MTELHLSHDSNLFRPSNDYGPEPRSSAGTADAVSKGHLLVFEGKFFEQYDSLWGPRLRYLISAADVADKPHYAPRPRPQAPLRHRLPPLPPS